MSPNQGVTGAHLRPRKGLKSEREHISTVHLVAISLPLLLLLCKRVSSINYQTQQADLERSVYEFEDFSRPRRELTTAPTLDHINYYNHPQQQHQQQQQQQQHFMQVINERQSQQERTSGQQKYLLDLLRNQQEQLQILLDKQQRLQRQQHQQQQRERTAASQLPIQSYPSSAFYSLDNAQLASLPPREPYNAHSLDVLSPPGNQLAGFSLQSPPNQTNESNQPHRHHSSLKLGGQTFPHEQPALHPPPERQPQTSSPNEGLVVGRPVASGPARPKLAVNLSGLIEPGEALLQMKENVGKTSPNGRSLAKSATRVVGLKDVRDILTDLKPLALAERDKATGLENAMPSPNDSSDAMSAYEQDERNNDADDSEKEKSAGEHLKSAAQPSANATASSMNQPKANQSTNELVLKQENDDDDQLASFVAVLSTLSAQMPDEDADEQNYLGLASTRESGFQNLEQDPRKSAEERPARTGAKVDLPVELLVDHLLAGSRLATRRSEGVFERSPSSLDDETTNTNENLAAPVGEHLDDEDDDDYDDEDEQQMPSDIGEGASLDEQESQLSELRVSLAENMSPVPNGSLSDRSSPDLDADENRKSIAPAEHQVAKQAKKVGKRGRRSKKSKASEEGLTIGNKKFTRLDLIRLIKVLHKMASSKQPSKERETSRRLLRHLIKLALANYRQSKAEIGRLEKNQSEEIRAEPEGGPDDRFKESLQALLVEPALGPSNSSSGGGSKASTMMQPWRVKSALIQSERHEGDEQTSEDDQRGGDLGRPKTLADISDDLERYFDADFFEDLADKTNATEPPQKPPIPREQPRIRIVQEETTTLAPVADAVLAPVVPDAKQADEADEEDVELDHVRVKSQGKGAATSPDADEQEESSEKAVKSKLKKSPKATKRTSGDKPKKVKDNEKKRKKQFKKQKSDARATEADEDEDEVKSKVDRAKMKSAESKKSRQSLRPRQKAGSKPIRSGASKLKQQADSKRKKQEKRRRKRKKMTPEETKTTKWVEEKKPPKKESKSAKKNDEDDEIDSNDEEQNQAGPRPLRKRRQRLNGQQRHSPKRKQNSDTERDEIPAPIMKDQRPRTSNGKGFVAQKMEPAKKTTSNMRPSSGKSADRSKPDKSSTVETVSYSHENLEICENDKCRVATKRSRPTSGRRPAKRNQPDE